MEKLKNIQYIHLNTIDSTNLWAKEHAHTFDPNQITCITADEQTAGRGRQGKLWISPKGKNIYASICFFSQPHPYLSNLGQILSLSLTTILKNHGLEPQIKWPNDILLSGKKLAGILTEISGNLVVLGIGLNVNMTQQQLVTINQPAISLAQISGHSWDLQILLESLLNTFRDNLILLQTSSFSPFVKSYEEQLAYKGEEIMCNQSRGILHSVNPDGTLNQQLSSGQMKILSSGELTLNTTVSDNRSFLG